MSNSFVPMKKMFERVQENGDPDPVLFEELLYAGEFLIKVTVLAAMALLEESEKEAKYRYLYDLVRTSNLSTWADTFKRVVSAPTRPDPLAAFAVPWGAGTWQLEAIEQLRKARAIVTGISPGDSTRVQLHQWLSGFASLRNVTRGHGATPPATKTEAVKHLCTAVTGMSQNNPLFSLPWVYLHRNLSGKYSLKALSESAGEFLDPNSIASTNLSDGIYIWALRPRQVPLLFGDIDARDFFVPNGNPQKGTFEIHSAISDERKRCDLSPFMAPPKSRPPSETEGSNSLEIVENTFTNIPARPEGYIRRQKLEDEVHKLLVDDRHQIVTLVGRGGIGKTSTALTVLHKICSEDRFDMLIWFSARDIDLTGTGPKFVRQHTRTQNEMSEEYRRLVEELEDDVTSHSLERHLRGERGEVGKSKQIRRLFVFDNFETVAYPIELYNWISTHVRTPNKVLITSRLRDFKGDYPIEVTGMEKEQARQLIADTCRRIGVYPTLEQSTIDNIIRDSEGHPYVIKILVGTYADRRSAGRPTTVISRRDDVLSALFERIYDNLTPLGVRLFLMLSAWRSLLPQIVIEAMLHWRATVPVTPEDAVDELSRMSLIEVLRAEDGNDFLRVPVAAAMFGRRKLEVNEQHELIMADVKLLRRMGHTTERNFRRGIEANIGSLFKVISEELEDRALTLESVREMLEFVATHHTPAWRRMAKIEQMVGTSEGEKRCLRLFLEHKPDHESVREVWGRLVDVCRESDDVIGSCNAFLHAAQQNVPALEEISEMANYLNSSDTIREMDPNQRAALLRPLAGMFRQHVSIASAKDLSRLAWLSLHVGDKENARKHAVLGIERQPDNVHCRKLIARLGEVQ